MQIRFAALLCALGFAASAACVATANDKPDAAKETEKFQGTWSFVSSESSGQKVPAEQLKELVLIFEGDKHTVKMGSEVIQAGTQKLDAAKSPKEIDVTITEGPSKGTVMLGIYEFDGDTLKVCFDSAGKKRPTEFKSPEGSGIFVNVHKRVEK